MKKEKIYIFIILFLIVLQAKSAINYVAFHVNSKHGKIKQSIAKAIPSLKIEEISASPVSGLVQVIANDEVFYTTENGKYFFHGDILDLTNNSSKFNTTEEARKKIRTKMINQISKNEMIIFSPESKPKNFVTVFTDLDCIFCKRFHKEIDKITKAGIEIRYLAFPRQGEGTENYKKTVSVWCSDKPNNMFTLASNGDIVPQIICESPIKKHHELGRQLRVPGTPTLVFSDGTMLSSYMSSDDLLKLALMHK